MLVIFFGEDLDRLLTPFFSPFILLFMLLGYSVLTLASILYIPLQVKWVLWRVLIPISINLITFCIVYYFYDAIGDLRVDMGFRINENRFNQAANWVMQSIQPNHHDIKEVFWNISLPQEYQDLSDQGKVDAKYEYGVIIIWFYRGGGMFEYGPSFVYRSDNTATPFEAFADIDCVRRLSPFWYDCY
jgi:hypothetical protein